MFTAVLGLACLLEPKLSTMHVQPAELSPQPFCLAAVEMKFYFVPLAGLELAT